MSTKRKWSYGPREKTWDRDKDPTKFCVVCETQMFRWRAEDGRIHPDTNAFARKRYCSMACRSIAFTNTEAISFQRLSPKGEERWVVDPVTECWVWQKGFMGKGYGNVWTGFKTEGAHRWAYESLVGSIPDDLELDHLCRNRACINPKHLEPVTNVVNKRRGIRIILTADKVREIRKLREQGVKYRVIAGQFGITTGAIHPIMTRKTWKDVL